MSDRTTIKIAFLSEIPTPYRIPIYQLLSQQNGISCEFYFCAHIQADRAWPIEAFHSLEKNILKGWQFQSKGRNTLTTFFNPEIVRILCQRQFALVVIGGWRQPTMLLALFTCLLRGIPYVLHSESHGRKPRSLWKKTLSRLYPGFFIRRAAGCLVTGSLAKVHVENLGAHPEKVWIFPNTIDVTKYQKESQRLEKKKSFLREELQLPAQQNILFVGRLVQVKGIEDLLEVFAEIAMQIPDWGLVIVGDGPLRNSLQHRIWNQPWSTRVTMLPYVDPQELIRYYVASDLFVLPSYDEPWAVVVNEAMACGLPVLLSDAVGAAGDLLKVPENGYGFPAGDKIIFKKQLLKLCGDAPLRVSMGQASANIIKDWGYNRNLQSFKDLINVILGVR